MKIVFLNGPPRSGKDTVGRALSALSDTVQRAGFADELKDAVHAAFGLDVLTNHFESRKDVPCEEFLGETPRNVYIAFSERYMKPLFGPGVFGRMLVKTLQAMEAGGVRMVAITDSGFREEAEEVLKVFPEAMLVRLHRPGTSFVGDSRSHIQLGIESVDMHNVGRNDPESIARLVWDAFNPPSAR